MAASAFNTQFTPIQDVGEFGLIERLRAVVAAAPDDDLLAGIADDAAVYRTGEGRVHVLTTDALIEGTHFDRTFTPLEHLGFKAISVNVSDVVAMNARPRWATVALGLPNNFSVEMAEQLYRGMQRACEAYGCTVVGGDTTAAARLTLSVTVVGEAEEEAVAYRKGARPGDLLCATGDLGGAYAGLKMLLEQRRLFEQSEEQPDLTPYAYVIERQLAPLARLDVIRDWTEVGFRPTALIDVSDGVASEVHHLCRQSGCGALVYAAGLPIDLQTRQVADEIGEDVDAFALFGGEDYELLFAASEGDLDALTPETYSVIGQFVEASEGVQVRLPEGDVVALNASGYQHFAPDGS